jgi:hypothetical protein
VNSHRLSGWKRPRRASGRRSKVKACASLPDFDREIEFFCTLSPSPPPGRVENRVSARIAERASIAAASRTGQFAHFRVVTPFSQGIGVGNGCFSEAVSNANLGAKAFRRSFSEEQSAIGRDSYLNLSRLGWPAWQPTVARKNINHVAKVSRFSRLLAITME